MNSPVEVPLIGSQLFINRGDSPDQVTAWMEQMAANGLRLVRLFILWDGIEPQAGRWDFAAYDAVFAAGERLNIGVIPTLMAETAPGWVRQTTNNQMQVAVDDPAHWQRGMQYVRTVVSRWANHPALHSWIVWNEASTIPRHTPAVLTRLRVYIAQRYQTVAALNAAWYPQLESFDDIEWHHVVAVQGGPVPSFLPTMDYWRFCGIYLHELLAKLINEVKAIDGHHPVHVNPHNVASPQFVDGQDVWASGRLFDFIGCSAHPVWHSSRFGYARYDESIAAFAAMMRGASKNNRFWVSELQGGAAIISGGQTHCPTRRDIRRWLWTSIGTGAEAILYWCFNVRHDGGEAGEWGLLDWQGQSSVRLQETTAVIQALELHRDWFAGATAVSARVRILASRSSWLHMATAFRQEQNPRALRNAGAGMDAMLGAFRALRNLGIAVDLVDEQQVRDGSGLQGCELLILPSCWVFESGTAAAIQQFTQVGGHLIADGILGWKDDRGFVDPVQREICESMMGAQIIDVECAEADIVLTTSAGRTLPGYWTRVILAPHSHAQVLATDGDQRPVAIQSERTTWWGTNVFQLLFIADQSPWLDLLAERLRPWLGFVQTKHATTVIQFMRSKTGDCAVVQNMGTTDTVEVTLTESAQWCPVQSTDWQLVSPGVQILPITADGTAFIRRC